MITPQANSLLFDLGLNPFNPLPESVDSIPLQTFNLFYLHPSPLIPPYIIPEETSKV